MLFYFVRHGQTDANRQQVLAGSGLDYPLNEEGHAQAQRLAEGVADLISHPVHRLIVSNMTRAQQTASYMSARLGLPIETVPDFREWHLGEWEGRGFAEFGHLLLGEGEPKEGEARQVFYSRVENAWREVHSDDRPYIVVAHGGVWLALQDTLGIPRFPVHNCSLVKVQVEPSASNRRWLAQILNAD